MEKIQKTFLYQINVTRDCNLRCTHCYIHSDVKASSKKMAGEQLMDIGKSIVEHMTHINYQRAEVHIVGGEPTMLGTAFFDTYMQPFKTMLKSAGFDVEVMLISNLLHDDIVQIAGHFDRVTTSYEVGSRFVSTKGVYKPALEQKWREKVKELQDAGIEVGVTTAVTKDVVREGAYKLLDMFYGMGIRQIHFGFFIPEGDGLVNVKKVMPQFHKTSEFLIDSANWYLQYRDKDPNLWVNPFESMLSGIYTGKPLDDIVCPIVSGSLDINWDGSSTTCLENGGSTNPSYVGNVFKQKIIEIVQERDFRKDVHNANKPQKICRSCDEYHVCKSGCGVLFKFFDAEKEEDCPGFKRFIKFVRQKKEEGLIPRYTEYVGGKGC